MLRVLLLLLRLLRKCVLIWISNAQEIKLVAAAGQINYSLFQDYYHYYFQDYFHSS